MSFNFDLYSANSGYVAAAADHLDVAYGEAGLAAHGLDTLFDDTRWDAPSFLAAADLIAEFRSQVVHLSALVGDAKGALWAEFDRVAMAWGVA
ncbi:hypothetical protein GCM10009860_13770 [Microbacterium mitrae]|uniref:Uncharacterized protein n=1 Tax=Microbacterium mitrae TaxID=664640 RepID=A0A5C8HMT5_9MICO|nr:hypothetical protein [Microbacterium mitrae]TXK03519.1 hypothetical protein FVP60_11650 [Microbacterium mitrae]